ncbi:3-keto-disaccharide hydrolase [Neptunicella sp. SCSIO 80796]|uniref:3-keto-disaccharide hydrolase n=1 Tax=Neptunicella plasticusilytica TaxID=3117012 RepID=UPI003A4D8C86
MVKSIVYALALASLISVSFKSIAQDNQLTAQEQAAGWKLLFNGKDMQQWRNFKKTDLTDKWVVEDGAIKLSGEGGGDILTKATYQNFELKLDWKISQAGNSGILIMADETGQYIYSHAPEIQILDNQRHPDNKLATHLSGSLYDMIASPTSSHKVAGEWNQVTIRLDNSLLQIWQNGVKTAEVSIHSKKWNELVANSKFADWEGFAGVKQGHIGLQDHGNPVWFKNIKIKELP